MILRGDEVLASTDPLPEPSETPDPANATTLGPSRLHLLALADLSAPLGLDPTTQDIFDALALDGPSALQDRGGNLHGSHAGNALFGQNGTLNQGFC